MSFDLPDIKPINLLKIEHVSSTSIQFQQLAVQLGCAADANGVDARWPMALMPG
jgi:hypothetical protein